jgi:hypothetical protein
MSFPLDADGCRYWAPHVSGERGKSPSSTPQQSCAASLVPMPSRLLPSKPSVAAPPGGHRVGASLPNLPRQHPTTVSLPLHWWPWGSNRAPAPPSTANSCRCAGGALLPPRAGSPLLSPPSSTGHGSSSPGSCGEWDPSGMEVNVHGLPCARLDSNLRPRFDHPIHGLAHN